MKKHPIFFETPTNKGRSQRGGPQKGGYPLRWFSLDGEDRPPLPQNLEHVRVCGGLLPEELGSCSMLDVPPGGAASRKYFRFDLFVFWGEVMENVGAVLASSDAALVNQAPLGLGPSGFDPRPLSCLCV